MGRSSITDPLEKYRFLVDFTMPDGSTPVRCGFHDVQMPKRSTNKVLYREGHEAAINTKSAGLSEFEDIIMSRGAIGTDGTAANDFYKWMRTVHQPGPGSTGYGAGEGTSALTQASNEYRSEVTIKMLNREGTPVRVWKLHQAWPVNFVPGSDLNAAEDGEKSMEALTLCYEDFQELSVADGVIGEPL